MWCSMLLFRVILVKSCICSLFCPVFDNPMNVLPDYQRYCGCIVIFSTRIFRTQISEFRAETLKFSLKKKNKEKSISLKKEYF